MKHGPWWTVAVCLFVSVIAPTVADGKPLKVCFKTADGKHYLERGTSAGHLRAVARDCKDHAVFLVRDARNPKRAPTFGKAVTLYAAKSGRYVWVSVRKKAAFASRKKVDMHDRRLFFQIDPVSGSPGAPLSGGERISIRSLVKGIPAYVLGGGGNSLSFGKPPKHKAGWGMFTIVKADER